MDALLAELRPILMPVAYNMTGSLEDAEDIVQDVLLAWLNMERGPVRNPRAYLLRATVNRCINFLQSACQTRVEHYHGTWLPEPWYFAPHDDAYRSVDLRSILAYDILYRLEELSPPERAVFVLKEGFSYAHKEIAVLLDIRPDHARQLLRRARNKVQAGRKAPSPFSRPDNDIVETLTASLREGKIEDLIALFQKDVALYSDGGGKVPAVPTVLYGSELVARVLTGFSTKARFVPRLELLTLNHTLAVIAYNGSTPDTLLLPCMVGKGIARIYIVRNPDKLRHFLPAD